MTTSRRASHEGATLVTGGAEAPEGLEKGFFIQPTVFSHVSNDMTIAREEIFGPVLSIIPFDTEEEAIEIANDTDYGLSGGVWAGTQEHASRGRPETPHRPSRRQRRCLQPPGALRRLQEVRHRTRARRFRLRGVPRGEVHSAVAVGSIGLPPVMTNPPPFETQETAGLRAGGFSSGGPWARTGCGEEPDDCSPSRASRDTDPVAAVVMFAASQGRWAYPWVPGTSRLAANLLRRGETPPECHQSTRPRTPCTNRGVTMRTWQEW